MVSVRRAKPTDKSAIFEFIRQAYQGRWEFKIPERWEWEYVHNPFLEEDELPIWIAVDEAGRVVGQTCALIEPLKLGDQVYRVGWSVDTFLDPQYRGQGIGYRLQKANHEAHQIFMSLSMSPANRRIKAALGAVPAEPVATYLRTVRHEPQQAAHELARRLFPSGGNPQRGAAGLLRSLLLDRALAGVLNRSRERQDTHLQSTLDRSLTVTQVEVFDQEVDGLWERVSPHFHAVVQRDRAFLNWKYVQQPHANYWRFLAHRGGQLCGFLVLRKTRPPEPDLGILVDLFTSPQDRGTIMGLIAHAVETFKREKVAAITAATTVPAYQAGLEAYGFRRTKEAVPMVHCRIAGPAWERAQQPGSWFLAKGDHDWDQFPLA